VRRRTYGYLPSTTPPGYRPPCGRAYNNNSNGWLIRTGSVSSQTGNVHAESQQVKVALVGACRQAPLTQQHCRKSAANSISAVAAARAIIKRSRRRAETAPGRVGPTRASRVTASQAYATLIKTTPTGTGRPPRPCPDVDNQIPPTTTAVPCRCRRIPQP